MLSFPENTISPPLHNNPPVDPALLSQTFYNRITGDDIVCGVFLPAHYLEFHQNEVQQIDYGRHVITSEM